MKFGVHRASVILLSAAGLLSPTRASAQKSAEPNIQSSSVPIKRTTRLVEVEVIAKDKKGRPVTGLTSGDFTLKDNGRTQKVSFFSEQQQEAPEAKIAKDPDNNGNKGIETALRQGTPNPPAVFSNNNSSTAPPVIILLDLLNTAWENQAAMKNALIASLKRSTAHAPTALLILGEKLTLTSEFTTDPASLAALLEKPATPNPEGGGPAITAPKTPNERANAIILKAALSAFRDEATDRLQRTINALTLIHSQLSRMRGRKSILWVGGGLEVGTHEWPAVQRVIETFNDSDIGVYTVDARGVVLDYGIGADVDQNDLLGPWAEERANTRGDVLDVVARNTGGVPYRNTNALDVAITRAVEDTATVYTLGYYPQHDDWRGATHKIEVAVARQGVNLRYRSSYIAAQQAAPELSDQQQTLQAIAASPLDFPGIRFSVELQSSNGAGRTGLVLHVPAKELQFSLEDEKSMGSLQYWIIQRQASGVDLPGKTYSFSFKLSPAELENANAQGITLTSSVKLSPATAKLRVLLRDINSGRVGTVDVPVSPGS